MHHTVHADGVLEGTVAGVRAVGAVPHLGSAGGLHEGVIVKLLRLAAALLPEHELGVALPNLVHLFGHQGEGLIPRDLLPLARHPLLIGAEEGCLHSVWIVEGLNLANALRAQGSVVARIGRMPLEVDNPSVYAAGEHAAVLLADPAGRGYEVLCKFTLYQLCWT